MFKPYKNCMAAVQPDDAVVVTWPTCAMDGCIGVQLEGHECCLAHVGDAGLNSFLISLKPRAELDLRGTPISADLLSALLTAFIIGEAPALGNVRFQRAQFTGRAGFEGVQFTGYAGFHGAQFIETAWFYDAQFTRTAGFQRTHFNAVAEFNRVQFSAAAFEGAQFDGEAEFHGATFTGYAGFQGATFGGYAGFGRVQFLGKAYSSD